MCMYVTCNMEYTYGSVTYYISEFYHWLDILHFFLSKNVFGHNNDTPSNISQ